MNLDPTLEQELLRQSARRFFGEHGRTGGGSWPNNWQRFVDLGWLGLAFDEAYGGLGGSRADVAILMQEFGRGLADEPYIPFVIIGGGLVSAETGERRKVALLPKVAAGEVRIAFAHEDSGAQRTVTRRRDSHWTLNGRKSLVLGAPAATHIIVSALTEANENALFILDASLVRGRDYPVLGGGEASDLLFTDIEIALDARLEISDVPRTIACILDEANVAVCAQMLGCADAMLEMSVDYAKTRRQFGQPLSSFQVIKHALADMAVACDEAHSLLLRAMLTSGPDFPAIVSVAKIKCSAAARAVAERAVQIHGAMGLTDELAIGSYFRRITASEILFGGPDEHLARLVADCGIPALV